MSPRTATGVDDALVDPDQQTRVLIVVDPAQSDLAYATVPASQVTVTTADDDASAPAPTAARPWPP